MKLSFDTHHLYLFEQLASAGSLNRAAARLHTTPSALSHQLKTLEDRLDTPLFRRERRRLVPTPAGEALLTGAPMVLAELRRLESGVRDAARNQGGVIRLSTECYTCYSWLSPLLSRFLAEHPAARVEIVVEATREPLAALVEDRLDVAIVSAAPRAGRWHRITLGKDELLAVCAPGHPWEGLTGVRARDLATEHLLSYDVSRQESDLFRTMLDPAGVEPARWSRVQLTEAIIEMVKAGLGVAVLADWAVAEPIRRGVLVGRRLRPRRLTRRWQALCRPEFARRDYAASFLRLLQEAGPL